MKPYFKPLFSLALLGLTTVGALAEAPSSKPYTINSSYYIAFSGINPAPGLELPSGPVTIIAESGNWIRIQYSTSKNVRSKADPGKLEALETVNKAWVNLDNVSILVDAPAAK
jgi:hypothetical protein